MCTFTARDGQYDLSKKQNIIEISHKAKKSEERSKAKKESRREKKNGGPRGVPLCAADTNFSKERKNERLAMKGKKEEQAGIK